MSVVQLQDALESSAEPAARRAAEMLRTGNAQGSTSVVAYSDLIDTLRVRRDIKRHQAATSDLNIVKLRDALESIVEWWDANQEEAVLYDHVTTDSAVSFIFWRRATTGTVLAGFETRDATRLTVEAGREFWGSSWNKFNPGI